MSSIRRLQSFTVVKNPKVGPTRPIEEFRFMYDARYIRCVVTDGRESLQLIFSVRCIYSDMAVIQGDLGRLGEAGGVQGLAAALRTDLKRGLYADEV